MLVVHHLNNSRSQRILWLLEELEVPYRIERYERDKKTNLAPPELRAIHPLGKSPVVVDGDQVVAESGAIITYLVDRYGSEQWRPAEGTAARGDYEFWLHYAEGSLMPLLLLRLIVNRIRRAPMPFFLKPIARGIADKVDDAYPGPQLKLHLEFVNDRLSGRTWLLGDTLTAADVQMSFPLEAGRSQIDYGPYPHIAAYVERSHQRPAYRKALDEGGPYAYGPA